MIVLFSAGQLNEPQNVKHILDNCYKVLVSTYHKSKVQFPTGIENVAKQRNVTTTR